MTYVSLLSTETMGLDRFRRLMAGHPLHGRMPACATVYTKPRRAALARLRRHVPSPFALLLSHQGVRRSLAAAGADNRDQRACDLHRGDL